MKGSINMDRFYRVDTKCGHVRKNYYMPIGFAIRAESAKEAAKIARNMPRVKHHHKDAIQNVQEISWEDYHSLRKQNDLNPYLHCKNVQEQRLIQAYIDQNIEEEGKKNVREKKKNEEYRYYIGKQQVRNIKRYINSNSETMQISKVHNPLFVA